MRKFYNWKYSVTHSYGQPTYDVVDKEGNDWYRLMCELEVRPEKWVVGVNPDGSVSWWSDGSVEGTYAPPEGGMVVVCEEFSPDYKQRWVDSEDCWELIPEVTKARTLEDVEADMMKLMAELKALKEGS